MQKNLLNQFLQLLNFSFSISVIVISSLIIFFSTFFTSCNFDEECLIGTKNISTTQTSTKETGVVYEDSDPLNDSYSWTVVVYMAADNSLESSAISDINEMERAELPSNVTVLALLDRSEGYDCSNGDWTDTRLYKIKHDKESSNAIISEQIPCEELELSLDKTTELDMSSKSTISGLLSFVKRSYKASNYAFIIWGHGTGWRSDENFVIPNTSGAFKAFAIDEGNSNTSYMTISSMRNAIEMAFGDTKLSFLGFDTCFGVCLESAYEFKNCAEVMVGTPSIESENGWDYKTFFDFFTTKMSSIEMGKFALEQYKKQYSNYIGATFCVLDLSVCEEAISSFNDFCLMLSKKIDSYEQRDFYTDVFQNKTISYKATNYPCDFYVDSKNLIENLLEQNSEYEFQSKLLKNFEEFVIDSWSASSKTCSPGVFYATYKSENLVSSYHPDLYVNGSINPEVSLFVSDVCGYVPSKEKNGSLLDKLFYTFF